MTAEEQAGRDTSVPNESWRDQQGLGSPGLVGAVTMEAVVNLSDLEVAEAADALPPRLGRSVILDYTTAAAAMISGLIVTPVLLHQLGKDAFGIWSLASVIVVYLGALDLGFSRATTKLVAEDAGRREEVVVSTVNTSFFVLCAFGAVALLIALGIAIVSPQLFSVPAGLEMESRFVFGALGLAVTIALPGGAVAGALVGYKRYDLFAATTLAFTVATALTTVGFAVAGFGIIAIAAAVAVIMLAMEVTRFVLLRRVMPSLRLRLRHVHRGRLRVTATLAGWFIARDVGLLIMTRVDLVVVGLQLGVADVAIFAVGLKLAQAAQATQVPLQSLFMPQAADFDRNGQPAQLRGLLIQGTRITLLAALPISIVLIVLSSNFISLWVGEGFGSAAT